MASPQVCGILACAATGRERFTNDDAIQFIRNFSRDDLMDFDELLDVFFGTKLSSLFSISTTNSFPRQIAKYCKYVWKLAEPVEI